MTYPYIQIPKVKKKKSFSHIDAILVLYANSILKKGEKPLQTLLEVSEKFSAFSTLHLLPFFPATGDRGFEVSDYSAVDKKFGDWSHIEKLSEKFELMFDLVLNHCSTKHEWFTDFLAGHNNYFISYNSLPDNKDIQKVFRPRTSPLFHKFGEKYVWTTFSKTQVDLNFSEKEIFDEFVKILKLYEKYASIIRIDAVPFLWKELGTSCVHLPQTHQVLNLLNCSTSSQIITESNVPFDENISYLNDEVAGVYNFSLPPVLLHTFFSQSLLPLYKLIKKMGDNSFLNFLDSHDGVGVLGSKGFLDEEERDNLISVAKKHGALISFKATESGKIPYEINATWFSLLNGAANDEIAAQKYLASRFIQLSLRGIPLIYIHGLLGSSNDVEGAKKGENRDINRENISPADIKGVVYDSFSHLLNVRREERAFHPNGTQEIVDVHKHVFSIVRNFQSSSMVCLCNISPNTVEFEVPKEWAGKTDIISHAIISKKVLLKPYEFMWIK